MFVADKDPTDLFDAPSQHKHPVKMAFAAVLLFYWGRVVLQNCVLLASRSRACP